MTYFAYSAHKQNHRLIEKSIGGLLIISGILVLLYIANEYLAYSA